MKLSIIIPTYNESENIRKLIPFLQQYGGAGIGEIIVVDACSSDNTLAQAERFGVKALKAPCKGRAPQMNFGALHAKEAILYFVHADTFPPKSFATDVLNAIEQGYEMGCFRYQFDRDSPVLRFNGWLTRFDKIFFRGGDQTFFIPKQLFFQNNGYREDFMIMEEFEFLLRVRKHHRFYIIPKNARVSARKYLHNSYLRVNLANALVFIMFRMGVGQACLVKTYKNLLNYR